MTFFGGMAIPLQTAGDGASRRFRKIQSLSPFKREEWK
ncbi:hypothetical protein GXM_05466 [Nostoc sphaeroides CCNUC1]|uniref:Uncharacterized protein n=1 Tax=Nostoc sphaeroides CCNUC1 TaxID=2653204 RepID=A0A5P8W5Q3_9NOSO|nr:hypothetical protein GXM_05466 [Nostoc sphaeroides CCNUC1]